MDNARLRKLAGIKAPIREVKSSNSKMLLEDANQAAMMATRIFRLAEEMAANDAAQGNSAVSGDAIAQYAQNLLNDISTQVKALIAHSQTNGL